MMLAVDLDLDVIQAKLPVVHDLWRVSSRSLTTQQGNLAIHLDYLGHQLGIL